MIHGLRPCRWFAPDPLLLVALAQQWAVPPDFPWLVSKALALAQQWAVPPAFPWLVAKAQQVVEEMELAAFPWLVSKALQVLAKVLLQVLLLLLLEMDLQVAHALQVLAEMVLLIFRWQVAQALPIYLLSSQVHLRRHLRLNQPKLPPPQLQLWLHPVRERPALLTQLPLPANLADLARRRQIRFQLKTAHRFFSSFPNRSHRQSNRQGSFPLLVPVHLD
jgi:hypothetical protein